MAYNLKDVKHMTTDERDEYTRLASKYSTRITNPPPEWIGKIPFLKNIVRRYNFGQYLEAAFFFVKSGDPVVDQKMMNALAIKDGELRFGLVSSAFWGGLFACLPGLKGYSVGTRIVFGSIPFALSYYRAFRRGYDQVEYVGSTYLELLVKRKALLEYLGENDGYLSDVKEAIMKQKNYKLWLELYDVKPYEDN